MKSFKIWFWEQTEAIAEWNRKQKNNRAAKAKEIQEQFNRQEALAELQATKKDNEMTSKYCPFVAGSCRATCVHFEKSKVIDIGEPCSPLWIATDPRCKTWKR